MIPSTSRDQTIGGNQKGISYCVTKKCQTQSIDNALLRRRSVYKSYGSLSENEE